MKKLSVVLLAGAMMAVFVTPSFAILRKDLQSSRGPVTYINPARTELTIKDSSSGKEMTFSGPVLAPTVVTGSTVIILYKTGTTVAKTVRVVPAKRSGAPAAAASVPAYSAPKAVVATPTSTMPKTTTPAKKSSW